MNFPNNFELIFFGETLVAYLIFSLFFGDFMDRKANPRLYDEIQDTEGLSAVRHRICFLSLSLCDSLTIELSKVLSLYSVIAKGQRHLKLYI